MYSNEVIEINLKRLYNSGKKSLMRTDFKSEKGLPLSGSLRFAEVLQDKGLIKLEPVQSYRCDLTELGSSVYENGGWVKYVESEKEKAKINAEKEKYDFLAKKWIYKYRLLPYIISGAALIISVVTLLANSNKQYDSQKMHDEIESLKSEIKKIELHNKINAKPQTKKANHN